MRVKKKKQPSWKKYMPNKATRIRKGYYAEHKNKQKKKIKLIIFIILILLLIQAFFQIKFFTVKEIELLNNTDLTIEEVKLSLEDHLHESKYLIFQKNNYFLLSTKNIKEILLDKYNLDYIQVKKKFPNSLEITVTEKISRFILQKDDLLYLLDDKGALNRKIDGLDDNHLIIRDLTGFSTSDSQMISPENLEIINNIYLSWQEKISRNIGIKKIEINKDITLIKVYSGIGFYVKLNGLEDIDKQMNNLSTVLSSNTIGNGVEYIDIRFGEQVSVQYIN